MTIFAILLAWAMSVGSPALQRSPGDVPFTFENNQIILRVSVNGHDSLNFLLDTGTDNSTIDEATARRIGLQVMLSESSRGGVPATVWLRDLKVGLLVMDSLFAWAPNLADVSQALRRPLHGVLGYSFLKDRIVQIDYREHVVRFLNHPPAIEKSGRNVMLPMHFLSGKMIPLFDALHVNGHSLRASLDTGSSLGLLLYPRATTELGLNEAARNARLMTTLVYGGVLEVRKGPRAELRLQTAVFDSVSLYFASRSPEEQILSERGGSLGNEFFKEMRLTLDYQHQQIAIER
ncbi:MAG TPA: retropepsin-like aspartic protease [bacterium]|jgi:hypothetical protein